MMVINKYMKEGKMTEAPVYIEGMISEVTGIHTAYPQYLSNDIRDQILRDGINPFESDYFTVVKQQDKRDEIVAGGPAIIMATAGMMEGGPVIDYFKRLASDENNALCFVSYQVAGTMGQRIQSGMGSAQMYGQNGKMEIINVAMKNYTIEGFSGHSDWRQLVNYVRRLHPQPKRVFVIHGEESKCENLSRVVAKQRGIYGVAPENLDTYTLA